MATLKDVARLAGVSATTVSLIVNGKAKERQLSEATVNKVTEAIRVLNYQPSISARALRSTEAPAFTVGIYWACDFHSVLLSRFITGIQNQLLNSPVKMKIVICPYHSDKLCNEASLYQTNTYNAVIIASASAKDLDYIHSSPIPIPTVLSNHQSSLYHTVYIDGREPGRKAACHLIAGNVKKVGIIALKEAYLALNSPVQGFLEISSKHGLALKPEHMIAAGPAIEDGYQAGRDIIAAGPLPEAIFCDNDACAIGIMGALTDHGLSIPDDIQVIAVSLGNINQTGFIPAPITFVDIPFETLAAKSLEIVERIATHDIHDLAHLEFAPVIYKRGQILN